MESNGYWQNVLRRRPSRRSALSAVAAAGLGTALTMACGSDGGGSSSKDVAGITAKVVDTTKQAKHGGVYRQSNRLDVLPTSVVYRREAGGLLPMLVCGLA